MIRCAFTKVACLVHCHSGPSLQTFAHESFCNIHMASSCFLGLIFSLVYPTIAKIHDLLLLLFSAEDPLASEDHERVLLCS